MSTNEPIRQFATRKLPVRIVGMKPRPNTSGEMIVYLTYRTDGGEVFREEFLLPRDLERLEALRAAVGWWAPGLVWERVGLILDSDDAVRGYVPAVELTPAAVNLFPWSWLLPRRFRGPRSHRAG